MDELMFGEPIVSIVSTDEKSLLFLMNYFFDNRGVLLGSTEHLYYVDHSNPMDQDDSIQHYLGGICGTMEGFTEVRMGVERQADGLLVLDQKEQIRIKEGYAELYPDFPWMKNFMVPALRYCKKIRQQLRVDVSKESSIDN
jgi:hypothetical protein